MRYPIEERNLKQLGNDDTSRRSWLMYKDAIKSGKIYFWMETLSQWNKIMVLFLMMMIMMEWFLAKNVFLNVLAILDQAHTSNGDVPYSLEAALLSSAHIRFHTGGDGYSCAYQIFCECCKKYIYNNETASFTMDGSMMVLPDAILCYKFMAILWKEKIGQYLFDKDFESNGINVCTGCILNCDTCIDCCIGNDQQNLDALSSNKTCKVCIQETLDIVDAFFRVIPMSKRNYPCLKQIFLPL